MFAALSIVRHLTLIFLGAGTDAKTGSVFCIQCNDFIFDSKLNEVYLTTVVMAEEKHTKFQGQLYQQFHTSEADLSSSVAKKPREAFKAWVPSEKDAIALEGAVAIPCQG